MPSQFLLSPRGQQLTSIQNFIQEFMDCRAGGSRHFLRVDSSANLERCCCGGGGGEAGGGGGSSEWALGQLSVGYAMNAVRHREENRSGGSAPNADARSTRSSQVSMNWCRSQILARYILAINLSLPDIVPRSHMAESKQTYLSLLPWAE